MQRLIHSLARPLPFFTKCALLSLLVFGLSNCSSTDTGERIERGSEQEAYDAARRQLDAQNWESAIPVMSLKLR